MQTLYQQFHKAGGRDLKVTEEVTGGILSLPIYELLPDSTIEKVSLAVRRLANHASSRKEVSLSGRQ
jgi:dTDP-4-amino-4,6-dideoxygalactose transaminase